MLNIYDRVVKDYNLKPQRIDLGGGIYGKMPDDLKNQLGLGNSENYDSYAEAAAKNLRIILQMCQMLQS